MDELFTTIQNLHYSDWLEIFERHMEWSRRNLRISGDPMWEQEDSTLNIIGIRCNSELDFNYGEYNDYLILILNEQNDEYLRTIIEVTVDPCRNKDGIAHLRQGVWNSYVIRPHKWAKRCFPEIGWQYRWAICQDKDKVQIVRTDGRGSIISSVDGYFGINIHDNGGYKDSSLGCTVIKSDSAYINDFLPCIYDINGRSEIPVNKDNLTYCLINRKQFENYL